MDLLLYLIRKNDLDVYDIPIAFVTEEYLKYINTLKELNIDFASEFLEMAAELAHIKSQMLLPQDEVGKEEEDIDPRADLIRRLIEYQRYKEAANNLNKRDQLYRDTFTAKLKKEENEKAEENVLIEGNAFLLFEAFNEMLAKLPKDIAKKAVTIDRISVNERILQIIERLKCGQTLPLSDLMPEVLTRYVVVVTFLALLEMATLKMLKVYQGGRFEPIYITGAVKEVSYEEAREKIANRDPNSQEGEDGHKSA